MPIALLAILAGGLSLYSYLTADTETAGEPARYYYRNAGGPVLFDHEGHQDIADCEDCHHELELASEDPLSCRGCHPAESSGEPAFLGCLDCHDDPDYAPGLFEHDELAELEDHDCEGCHSPRAVSEAYHGQCSACHLDLAPGRFAAADGQARCEACHLE